MSQKLIAMNKTPYISIYHFNRAKQNHKTNHLKATKWHVGFSKTKNLLKINFKIHCLQLKITLKNENAKNKKNKSVYQIGLFS